MILLARRMTLGAIVASALWVATQGTAIGLSCATPRDGAEVAIRSGWPEAAPADHVLIATIRAIEPINGDAETWGEVLSVRVDAVLRGDLSLAPTEIFNPPLGSPGWPWFRVGGQFLIAAHDSGEGSDGRIQTNLCAPNEEITSVERFRELVALSADPRISNTAMPPPDPPVSPLQVAGLALVATAGFVAARRRMGRDE